VDRNLRGGIAGAAAATLWMVCDPLLERTFRTPYTDAKLIGPFITEGPLEPLANLATHAGGGFAFGYVFTRLGGRGVRQGVAAALAENTLLWPGLAVFDRIHPKRRRGEWPRLVTSPRVFGRATAGHLLFGVFLGILGRRV
jgi:hypothetical protein